MNNWYTLLLLVALYSGTQSGNAASRISKRQADLVDSKTPGSAADFPVTEPVDSPRGQLSPASIVAEAQRRNESESAKSATEISVEKLQREWWGMLTASANRLKEAFARYDRANATKSGDIAKLGYELKFFKLVFDTEYYLYQQRIAEIRKNSTDSTGSKVSTDLKDSTNSNGSANLKDSTNTKNSLTAL